MITKEMILEANAELDKVDIKGKNYVLVCTRIGAFRRSCPGGVITTKILEMKNGEVTMQAEIYDDDGKLVATGYAHERQDSSFINKTSYIENCETSAVGRALGFLGIGVDESMASADEVANAILNQDGSKGKRDGKPQQRTQPAAKAKAQEPQRAPEPQRASEPPQEMDLSGEIPIEKKKRLHELCKDMGLNSTDILQQAGWSGKPAPVTEEIYGKACIILKDIADEIAAA